MPDVPVMPTSCYLPDCSTAPRWRVSDLNGEGALGACEPHLARLVDRKQRRLGAAGEESRVILSPLFEVEDVRDLAPMIACGAEVYGLVAAREIPGMVDSLSGAELDALFRSYGGREALR